MRRNVLAFVVSGILVMNGTSVLGEELRPSGEPLTPAPSPLEQKVPIRSFEQRLSLKPLSDEELAQISASGLGPGMPFPFQPFLFLPILYDPWHNINQDFVRGSPIVIFKR